MYFFKIKYIDEHRGSFFTMPVTMFTNCVEINKISILEGMSFRQGRN